ncbi:YjfB family protein [Acutalibacter intestini]|uniref:YjfB family protein n=1 Tax=Acutalibacter intestini TaxID=3093659 RepID=UPI002AC9B9FA|nr:YjfB family protein [Acutalibacter sp. M00204]
MDMMNSIAATGMAMSQARFATEYSMTMTKKVMDNYEDMAMSMIEEMLPPSPYNIDVYA